ncbi:hypothetical protein I4U23_027944 [Adineta vaga]|nr:hypothetical protein I4U23_027944 [Adineta vaga]
MSVKIRQLFVGVIDNEIWTQEKLCAYFTKHGTMNDDQYILDCQMMSYNERRFEGKSFAFIEFNDKACVDLCMSKRDQFNEEYGITIKRLLPDTIPKCQRLISSPGIVIRMNSSGEILFLSNYFPKLIIFQKTDSLFTDVNIRSYFGTYGNILDVKMLEEENTAGICFILFEHSDSSDRVLLDMPHYLNGQILSIDKYSSPEYVCSLSQYRCIDENDASRIQRWYPIFRNLTDFILPIHVLYKTQYALLKYSFNQQILTNQENLKKIKENCLEFENRFNDLKQKCDQLCKINDNLQKQIKEIDDNTSKKKREYEDQIQEQKKRNQELQNAILYLSDNSKL